MQKIILDTSALISIFENSLNIDAEIDRLVGEHEIIVPSSVVTELSLIGKREARMAERLASRYTVFDSRRKGDDSVAEAAKSLGAFAVVTNDMRLARELSSKGVRVMTLRSGRKLDFFRSDEAL
ncbi:MAG: twitching motility protein PilT [Thermoplasmata archaeon]|uniref:Twitching motility protein PilT n=1 Tax=Candidatus Sysuiplasma superficiale TaxID=2823368 RepID=A0A8J7YRJ3_9ARCH|nr:twitching motility protein PilT [Candidatus Sysuiplasma superficiale]MBX8643304.1 twitching motility protein PilT [Candidatus Sysuiplasma superficiale]MCL5437162.1 twitching motility protein PilT [Candidatus Thermoplasmatota archaeon]